MFEHSIKVPRLYKTAAKIVERIKKEGASVKQLVYEKKHPNLKALYALVVETLRNEENLKIILKKTQLLEKEPRLDQFLARVLISELLWGKKKLPGESKPIKTILSYQDQFLDNYTDKKTKVKKQKITKLKYVRVNTLKISLEEVINSFRDEGWSLIRCGDGSDYSAFLATLASLSEDQFMVDTLIKDLLIFPPRTEFYEHRLYKNGSIVLQDKASCISPFLLNPPEGATVLDMCAAPGMKTMQVASMVGPNGRVYAIERDPRRYDILKSLLEATESNNVTAINNDVLKITDFDVPDVEYILVDPSCSGSGIIDRIEFEDNSQIDGPRLKKLFGFQIKILRYALENFKNAKRIVYSTCSIYPQENEDIVKEAIEQTQNFKLVALNDLLKNKWYNFGSKKYEIGPYCLYANPEIDKTNGFFIAVFERLKKGETNPFYVEKNANLNQHNIKNSSEVIKVEKKDQYFPSTQELTKNLSGKQKNQKNNLKNDEIRIKVEKIDPTYDKNEANNEKVTKNKPNLKIENESNSLPTEILKKFENNQQIIKNEVFDTLSPKRYKKKCKKSKKEHENLSDKNITPNFVSKSKKSKSAFIQDESMQAEVEENSLQSVQNVLEPKLKKKGHKNLELEITMDQHGPIEASTEENLCLKVEKSDKSEPLLKKKRKKGKESAQNEAGTTQSCEEDRLAQAKEPNLLQNREKSVDFEPILKKKRKKDKKSDQKEASVSQNCDQDKLTRAKEQNLAQNVEKTVNHEPNLKKKRKKGKENDQNDTSATQNCDLDRLAQANDPNLLQNVKNSDDYGPKLKKNRKKVEQNEPIKTQLSENEPKPKQKKNKLKETTLKQNRCSFDNPNSQVLENSEPKVKKKRKNNSLSESIEPIEQPCEVGDQNAIKKSKKNRNKMAVTNNENQTSDNLLIENEFSAKKKKKKKEKSECMEDPIYLDKNLTTGKQKKCKKSHKNKEIVLEPSGLSEKKLKKKSKNDEIVENKV